MVNQAFNDKKEGLIPKDHKDVVSVILKLRKDLHFLAEYRLKPLPEIYKQVCNLFLKLLIDSIFRLFGPLCLGGW
jgi:hypothetical protein